jgi:hypothetical protein
MFRKNNKYIVYYYFMCLSKIRNKQEDKAQSDRSRFTMLFKKII